MSVTASCAINLKPVHPSYPSSPPSLYTRSPKQSLRFYVSCFSSTPPFTGSPSELFHFLWLTSKTYFHSGLLMCHVLKRYTHTASTLQINVYINVYISTCIHTHTLTHFDRGNVGHESRKVKFFLSLKNQFASPIPNEWSSVLHYIPFPSLNIIKSTFSIP